MALCSETFAAANDHHLKAGLNPAHSIVSFLRSSMRIADLFAFASAVGAAFAAIVATVRTGRSVARWSFVAGMLVLTAERTLAGLGMREEVPSDAATLLFYRSVTVALLPACWFLFSLTYARGNADEYLRRWRFGLVAALVLPLGVSILLKDQMILVSQIAPGASTPHYTLGVAGAVSQVIILLSCVLILMNMERTFRASTGMIRWRIKYMALGVGLLFVIRLFTATQALLYREFNFAIDSINSAGLLVAVILMLRALLRTERFTLHVHPSNAVLQGSVTVVFIGIYLVLVGAMASLANHWGSGEYFVVKAFIVLTAIVGLAVVLQSDQVNLHLRRFVSRHFKRPFYDYQKVWSRFTEGTASRMDQNDFCQAVVRLMADTFKSLSVSLWLVDERHGEFSLAASTSVSPERGSELKPDAAGNAILFEYLRAHADPVDIEQRGDVWAVILRRCHPDEFKKGGHRVCVPIVPRGEVLAFIILGDRVGGAQFTLQDLDLLKSIGEHVSSGLLNVRLSQRLLQAREHEAFQTMAAFFVHDLKNAASTLSLMLQNLPTHFDDPEFRQDALRAVGKSVEHINRLISRLSELRKELKITRTESDLNEIVSAVAGTFENHGFIINRELQPVSKLMLDREQISKVVMNLILNAREASNGTGRMTLSTAQAGSAVMLTASDNGCGMSEDFVNRSLFRPFQTTKKNGLGIGMFQSKMIVEAHGGRIAVESSPGHGTTFRVFFPLSPAAR